MKYYIRICLLGGLIAFLITVWLPNINQPWWIIWITIMAIAYVLEEIFKIRKISEDMNQIKEKLGIKTDDQLAEMERLHNYNFIRKDMEELILEKRKTLHEIHEYLNASKPYKKLVISYLTPFSGLTDDVLRMLNERDGKEYSYDEIIKIFKGKLWFPKLKR